MEPQGNPQLNRFLLINSVLFILLFLMDFFSPPGRWLAAAAAVTLCWNGGCFLVAGWHGRLPGEPGPGFSKPVRALLFGAGGGCFLGGMAAAILTVV